MRTFKITLTESSAEKILTALGSQPYINVAELISDIQNQAQEQIDTQNKIEAQNKIQTQEQIEALQEEVNSLQSQVNKKKK